MEKKGIVVGFILFLVWQIGVVIVYLTQIPRYENSLVPYQVFPQEPPAYNFLYPFLWVSVCIFPSILLGVPLAWILFKTHEGLSWVKERVHRRKAVEIQYTSETIGSELGFFGIYGRLLLSSLTFFNLAILLASTPQVQDFLLYPENILGSRFSYQLAAFYALLPLLFPTVVLVFVAIWFLDKQGLFFEQRQDGSLVGKDTVSSMYFHFFRGYTGVSSLISVVTLVLNFRAEVANFVEYPTFNLVLIVVFVVVGLPVIQIPVVILVSRLPSGFVKIQPN